MNLSKDQIFSVFKEKIKLKRGTAFMVIMVTALVAFEIFNYSTTDFALSDLLGDLRFAGIRWATILSIAFCGIDFAGIARLFTPESGQDEPKQIWYLFGAWLLAATMNAILTWWGVSMAITNHPIASSAVLPPQTLLTIVPIFVAIMIWLIRILIIGSLSVRGDRLLHGTAQPGDQPAQKAERYHQHRPQPAPSFSASDSAQSPISARPVRPAPKPKPKPVSRPENTYRRPEPTYHSLSMSSRRKDK
jgi:hypothetical protein